MPDGHQGYFKVTSDPLAMVQVFQFQPPTMNYAIAAEQWLAMQDPQYAFHSVVKEFNHYYGEMLMEHLRRWWEEQYLPNKHGLLVPKKHHSNPNPPNALSMAEMFKQVQGMPMPEWQSKIAAMFVKHKNEAAAVYASAAGSIDEVLEQGIPGFHQVRQPCPDKHCSHPQGPRFLRDTIIHLNDYHHWPREEIADWLDTLDHDLRFQVPGGGEEDGTDH